MTEIYGDIKKKVNKSQCRENKNFFSGIIKNLPSKILNLKLIHPQVKSSQLDVLQHSNKFCTLYLAIA